MYALDANSVSYFLKGRGRVADGLPALPRIERIGKPIGPMDLLVAANAVEQGAVLVTHNAREFRRVRGLRVEDWYT